MSYAKTITLILSLVCLSACVTAAQQQAASVDTAPGTQTSKNNITFVHNTVRVKTNAKGEPLICKEFTKTGTRLQTVVQCNTKAEWDYIKQRTQENIENMYLKHGSDHG